MGNPKKRISVSNRLFLINGGTAVADLNSMAFSASGTCDERIWDERRAHLGRAMTASGTSDDRIWDVQRPYLGRATSAPRPRFADKSCFRIFML